VLTTSSCTDRQTDGQTTRQRLITGKGIITSLW